MEAKIIELFLSGESIATIASSFSIQEAKVTAIIESNTENINEYIKKILPKEWHSQIVTNSQENIKTLQKYKIMLSVSDEILNIRTKISYLKMLDYLDKTDLVDPNKAKAFTALTVLLGKSYEN